eukprot:TRINITY_DN5545_c0_g1_i1.p1 TRINITY_DN5545_c0_g1~~TRINITY_DN5545_c0_g1_i1.p1  ORF type:complete len:476 (+),score=78.46 TRINITY_DN5545_c0_g1_i1:172-1599(+)
MLYYLFSQLQKFSVIILNFLQFFVCNNPIMSPSQTPVTMLRPTVTKRQNLAEGAHTDSLSQDLHKINTPAPLSRPRRSFSSLFTGVGKKNGSYRDNGVAKVKAVVSETTKEVKGLETVSQALVLTADIGGTNCRLQLWNIDVKKAVGEGRETELFNQTYAVEDYNSKDGFEQVLENMLKEPIFQQYKPQAACFAVAGPVIDGTVDFTNSPWVISAASVSERFKWQVALLNDFEAVGYGVVELNTDQLIDLRPDVPRVEKAPMVVLGPGTGLGEAQMMWDTGMNMYKVWPSEGSHADFAPRGWKQQKLLEFCEIQLLSQDENGGHCEVEHVACGSGLTRIYGFLSSDNNFPRTLFGKKVELDDRKLSPADVANAAATGTDPFAEAAMDMFLSIIGQEAGHMALRAMAYGGVFIAGGIIPKNLERALLGQMTEGFLNSQSRFNKVLQKFPLFLVKTEDVGLIGTREYAVKLLRDRLA